MKKKTISFILLLVLLVFATVSVVTALSFTPGQSSGKGRSSRSSSEAETPRLLEKEEIAVTQTLPDSESGSQEPTNSVVTHELFGKTYRLYNNNDDSDPLNLLFTTYKDEDGNVFKYDELGNFVGITFNPESFDNSVSMEHKEDPSHPFTCEDAVAAAGELGEDQFGVIFEKLNTHYVYTDDSGEKTVWYYQFLGDDDFIVGIHFHATYLGDGTLLAFSMPNYGSLAGFDESLIQGADKVSIKSYLGLKTKELYGDDLIDWGIGDPEQVSLVHDKDGYYLDALVTSRVNSSDGELLDGGIEYRIDLPFEG